MSKAQDERDILALTIPEDSDGARIDKALATLCDDLSRTRIKALIQDGDVRVNGAMIDNPSHHIQVGDDIRISIPPVIDADPMPEDIPLSIVYEDSDLLVIDKPVGMVVHPGAGNQSGTLVNALLHHCGDDLSGIGGVARPGIVHRLDKDTSGLLVVAKHDKAHQGLSDQLSDRSLTRVYQAFVWKIPSPIKGKIDHPIDRHKTNRLKMAIRTGGREAITAYHVKENYGQAAALVECRLQTGRTHQIRAHMHHIKHPIIGDPLYGLPDQEARALLGKAGLEEAEIGGIMALGHQALHAGEIGFIHPINGENMRFESALPESLKTLKDQLKSIS